MAGSLFDRLHQASGRDRPARAFGEDPLLRRLETILNTRLRPELIAEQVPGAVGRSVVAFGIPDPTTVGLRGREDGKALAERVSLAIGTFEPGVKVVSCTPQGGNDVGELSLHIALEIPLGDERDLALATSLDMATRRFALRRVT